MRADGGVRTTRRSFSAPAGLVVPKVIACPELDEPGEEAGPPAGAVFAPVGAPEPETVAGRHAGNVRRVEELPEVLRLPPRPGPAVPGQAVQVDHADAAEPVQDPRGVRRGDVGVA